MDPFDFAENYIEELPPGFRFIGIFLILTLVTLLSVIAVYTLVFITSNILESIVFALKITYAIIR